MLCEGLGGFIAIAGVVVISYQERDPQNVNLDGPDYEYSVFEDGEENGQGDVENVITKNGFPAPKSEGGDAKPTNYGSFDEKKQ